MRTIISLLIAGIIWTQVTPMDQKGCAGYSPTLTPDSPPVQVQPHNPEPPPAPPEPVSPASSSAGDYTSTFGDNQGHGQFDSTEE